MLFGVHALLELARQCEDRCSFVGIVESPSDDVDCLGCVVERRQPGVCGRGDGAHDGRDAQSGRVEDAQREPLVRRRVDVERGRAEEGDEVLVPHPARHLDPGVLELAPLVCVAVPDPPEPDARVHGERASGDLGEQARVLLGRDPPDHDDRACTGPRHDGRACRAGHRRRVRNVLDVDSAGGARQCSLVRRERDRDGRARRERRLDEPVGRPQGCRAREVLEHVAVRLVDDGDVRRQGPRVDARPRRVGEDEVRGRQPHLAADREDAGGQRPGQRADLGETGRRLVGGERRAQHVRVLGCRPGRHDDGPEDAARGALGDVEDLHRRSPAPVGRALV